jgi:hypothetical protein
MRFGNRIDRSLCHWKYYYFRVFISSERLGFHVNVKVRFDRFRFIRKYLLAGFWLEKSYHLMVGFYLIFESSFYASIAKLSIRIIYSCIVVKLFIYFNFNILCINIIYSWIMFIHFYSHIKILVLVVRIINFGNFDWWY